MSVPAILILLLVFALFAVLLGVRRGLGMHRRSAARGAGVEFPAGTGHTRAPLSRPCSACGGSGFTTRMQPVMETRTETQTEFYTYYAGRSATRMVARPKTTTVMKTVRVPCGFCGGSGRSRS